MATEKTQTGLVGWWNHFAGNHPKAAKWIREGGLFVIVSNLVTVLKYFILQFLPLAFQSLSNVDFGWPGIPVTLFGETFQWNIFGYDAAHGGLGYFCAYMIAMAIGEIINFPIQRNFVFRSKGNLAWQIAWYIVGLHHHQLHRQLHQLRVGGRRRHVRARLHLQHRHRGAQRRYLHGHFLLRQQGYFP